MKLILITIIVSLLLLPQNVINSHRLGAAGGSTLLTGLVSFWKLEEASGTRADVLGSNNLTDNNTVTQATGKVGNAAQFVAANSEYLDRVDNATLDITSSLTITCWVYLDSAMAGTAPVIVGKWNQGTNNQSYALLFNGFDNRFQFSVTTGGSNATQVDVQATTFGAPSTATWYFVMAYFDDTANVIGISVNNGTENTTAFAGNIFNGNSNLYVGNNPGWFYNGRIDASGIWSRTLTTTEKATLYNSGNGLEHPF